MYAFTLTFLATIFPLSTSNMWCWWTFYEFMAFLAELFFLVIYLNEIYMNIWATYEQNTLICVWMLILETRINSGSSFIINYETMPFCFLKSMHTNTFLFLAIIINTTMNVSCFIHEFVFYKHLFVYLWINLKWFTFSNK